MKTFLLLMLLACPAFAETYEVSGRVTGPDGEPMARAHLSFRAKGGSPFSGGRTLGDGTFSATLEEGVYLLEVERQGYADAYLDSIEVNGGPVDGIELRMERLISVEGRVVIPPGERVLFALALRTGVVGPALAAETFKVAEDGSFRVALGPGEWQIRVRAQSRNDAFLESRFQIELKAGQPAPPVEVELPLGAAALEGRFAETFSDHWAARLVRDFPGGTTFEADVRRDGGGFRFDGLAPGSYTLQIYEAFCDVPPKVIHEQPVVLPAEQILPVRLAGGTRRAQ